MIRTMRIGMGLGIAVCLNINTHQALNRIENKDSSRAESPATSNSYLFSLSRRVAGRTRIKQPIKKSFLHGANSDTAPNDTIKWINASTNTPMPNYKCEREEINFELKLLELHATFEVPDWIPLDLFPFIFK